MEEPLQGRLLLVGEGDFSFAVSLMDRCEFPGSEVVVSSVETLETIHKHQLAAQNRNILESKGVKVCFEVDATDLPASQSLNVEEQGFSRIIFNFPHAGGKSNHKKNRALLNDFFSSAVKVLALEGQIMVSLCKGQGGTPADKPMRAWHDSWQVVSMAANSNLILTHVLPFKSEDFPQYHSVGFRSQDKGFNTEGALTHVFEVGEGVQVPAFLEPGTVTIAGDVYVCPTHLQHRIHRKLLYCQQHPLHILRTNLEDTLHTSVASQAHHLDDKALLKQGQGPRVIPEEGQTEDKSVLKMLPKPYFLCEMSGSCVSLKEEQTREEKEKDDTETVVNGGGVRDSHIAEDGTSRAHLRSTVLEELPALVSIMSESGVVCHVVSADTYGQCTIGKDSYPVRHEMMIVCRNANSDMLDTLCQTIKTASNANIEPVHLDVSVRISSDFGELKVTHKIQADSEQFCGLVLQWMDVKDGQSYLVIILDLNFLVLQMNAIPSHALLWSGHPKLRKQFSQQSRFESVSLYPMKFFHDLSFWENESKTFDELEFHNIVRNVTGDVVTDVRMIDSYNENNRSSRCYRLSFQSHDQALSYITSWRLQSMLRLEVAKCMGITLR